MKPIHPLDPVCMSPDARLAEVAAILAMGIVRLRTPPGLHEEKVLQKDLGFCPPQRVHSTPDTQVRSAVRTVLLAKMKGV
ncbi:MAG: hypothetical protein ING32_08370 [Curvibacter sp.]|nr:hypothetical protein [Curvibacter sp.]